MNKVIFKPARNGSRPAIAVFKPVEDASASPLMNLIDAQAMMGINQVLYEKKQASIPTLQQCLKGKSDADVTDARRKKKRKR